MHLRQTVTVISTCGKSAVTGPIVLNVGTLADLNAAIKEIDAEPANAGAYQINLTADIVLNGDIEAINLKSGVTLTVDGGNSVIDGDGKYRGFFVYSGAVTIEDLTIQNAAAIGGVGGPAAGRRRWARRRFIRRRQYRRRRRVSGRRYARKCHLQPR